MTLPFITGVVPFPLTFSLLPGQCRRAGVETCQTVDDFALTRESTHDEHEFRQMFSLKTGDSLAGSGATRRCGKVVTDLADVPVGDRGGCDGCAEDLLAGAGGLGQRDAVRPDDR